MKVLLFAILYLFNGTIAEGKTCLQLFNSEKVTTEPQLSLIVRNLFHQKEIEITDEKQRVLIYSQEMEALVNSGQRLRLDDLYFIAKKMDSLANKMDPRVLTSVFHFFAFYSFRLPASYLKNYSSRIKEVIGQYSENSLAQLLSIIASTKMRMPHSFKRLIENTFYENKNIYSVEFINSFSVQYFKIYGVYSSINFVRTLEQVYIERQDEFDSQQTYRLLRSLMLSYAKPSTHFLQHALNKLETRLSPKNVSEILKFLVLFQIPVSDEFRLLLIDFLMNHLSELSDNQVTQVAYQLYLLGEFEIIKTISNHPQVQLQIEELSISSLNRIQILQMYFTHVLKEKIQLFSIDISKNAFKTFNHSEKSTKIEDIVEQWLLQQNANFYKEYQVRSGHYVDFFIPATNTIIEVDGPHHFLRLENREITPLLKDKRLNELHQALGYSIIRINYLEIRERTRFREGRQ